MTTAAKTAPTGTAPVTPIKAGPQMTVPKSHSDLDSDTELVVLPDPVGHFMLIALPTMEEMTKGGIIIPRVVNDRERAASVVGTVLAMGSTCYKDPKRFGVFDPHTEKWDLLPPWCKLGDEVLFGRYQGMRFRSYDKVTGEMVEYRMLADDAIVGTVPKGAQVGGL